MARKNLLSICTSLVLAAAMLGGCASSKTTDQPTPQTEQKQDNSAAATNEPNAAKEPENVELRFYWWGNDARHEATLAVIDKYMELNPHVKIEAEYSGKSDREKIATQIAGGEVADIVQLNQPWMAEITSAGDFFVDLNSKSDLLDISGFDQTFMNDYGVYNGTLIALPTGLNARVTLLNTDAAKTFGLPTDMNTKWSWADLLENGKKVNQTDKAKYFLNSDTRTLGTFVLRPYIIQQTGEQFIKDDFTLGFTKDQLVEGLTYIDKLYKEGVLQPVQESNVFMDVTSTNPKWINGDIVSEFMWTSQMVGASKDVAGETAAFIMPMHDAAKNSALTVQPSQLLAVSNKSKHIDEAVKFVNYFFNDIEAGKILKDHRSIPPVAAVRDACLADQLLNKNVVEGVDYALKNVGLAVNAPSSSAEIEKIITDSIEKVAYSQASTDKIADETILYIEDILNTMKAK